MRTKNHPTESGQFTSGFIAGAVAMLVAGAGIRVTAWAMDGVAVEKASSVVTRPMFSIDDAFGFLLFIVILIVIAGYTYIGPR